MKFIKESGKCSESGYKRISGCSCYRSKTGSKNGSGIVSSVA